MSQSYPHLFSPFRLRGLEIRNRILSTGHDTDLGRHGLPSEALIAYQRARAKGGVGLIIVQVVAVHETARYTSEVLMGTSDAHIAGLPALVPGDPGRGHDRLRPALPSRPRAAGPARRHPASGLCALQRTHRALPHRAAGALHRRGGGDHRGLWPGGAAHGGSRRPGRGDRGEPRLSPDAIPATPSPTGARIASAARRKIACASSRRWWPRCAVTPRRS